MDSVVILCYGKELDKFRVKFIENSDMLEYDDQGKLLDFNVQKGLLKTEFSEGFLNATDQYHAMVLANMLINDLGDLVNSGTHGITFKGEL